MLGTVIWFNEAKGYGFVAPDGGDGTKSSNFFAHITEVIDGEKNMYGRTKPLVQGQRVEFDEATDTLNRRTALNVTVAPLDPDFPEFHEED